MSEGLGQVKAYVLNTGQIFKLTKSEQEAEQASNVILDDKFKKMYGGADGVLRPPFNPDDLVNLMRENTYHRRAIKQKAVDTIGMGYQIIPFDPDPDKEEANKKKKKEIEDFFKNCNKMMNFEEVMERAQVDFECVGWLAIELTRYKNGKPARLNHIPAHTVRVKADGTGLVQKRGTQTVHFKWIFDEEKRIDPISKKPMTEVIYLVNYSPESDFYGVPDYIPSVGAMVGNNQARDYNINFFGNNAIPQYAVILEGGELTDEVEQKIVNHFKNLKGVQNSHKTLILSGPQGSKIQLVPLAVEVKEGHFRLYRKDNRDEIIASHGVPGYRLGVIEVGALGGNVAQESTKIYKYSIINPRQQRLETRFTQIIRKLFESDQFYFKFNEIDIEDEKIVAEIEKTKAEAAKIWLETGVLTPNEARKKYHNMPSHKNDKDGWGDKPIPLNSKSSSTDPTNPKIQNAELNQPDDINDPDDQNGTNGENVKKSKTLSDFKRSLEAKSNSLTA